jgi:hypothetical protein
MGRTEIPWRSIWRAASAIFLIVLWIARGGPRFSRRSQILWLAAILALFLIERAAVWWSRRRIKFWPSANARIEFAKVMEDPGGGPSGYVLELSYSYQVGGARYGGAYREAFPSEERAKRSLRFFEDLPVPVRYHPRDPSRSVLDPHWLASLATRASVEGAAAR